MSHSQVGELSQSKISERVRVKSVSWVSWANKLSQCQDSELSHSQVGELSQSQVNQESE